MEANIKFSRVGVYVDVVNLNYNGGFGMRYEVLRSFACRDNSEPIHLNAYVAYDVDRAKSDPVYKEAQLSFYSTLRDFGYKVIQKNLKWYTDETGTRIAKANADLDMAVDILLQSKNMDRVLIATGDGDFSRVITALQNSGCRVEIIAFENVSHELRSEADMFISGYLIPNLLPVSTAQNGSVGWGNIGSRVRGVCYSHTAKGYGFIRYLKKIAPDLWKIDSREEGSPYESVFFHDSQLPDEVLPSDLPNRQLIFEFELARAVGENEGKMAINMELVYPKKKKIIQTI
ncbi:MAG: hypothetical protein Kow0098_07790 [Ignavibacteriaceae bacterium]